ncbi:lipoprotein N-acyltransferase Lnb domain-containing protein [Myroides sp. LJL119]
MAKVSVLTCGTALESYALYGHTAIWIQDPLNGVDEVFNFGMFSFDTPNFTAKFVKGNLFYYADYTTLDRFIRPYIYENRSVYLQELNLNMQQKQDIYGLLSDAVLPENREFLYKFIQENCTTKVIDILQEVIKQPINSDVSLNKGTYRDILSSYVDHLYLNKLGINLLLGYKTNMESEQVFLPLSFMQALDNTVVDEQPLVKHKAVLFEHDSAVKQDIEFYNSAWFFYGVVILMGLLCLRFKVFSRFTLAAFGVFGFFLVGLTLYSTHMEFARNTSIMLFNPILLVLSFLRNNTKIFKILYGVVILGLVLFVFVNLTSIKLPLSFGLFLVTLVVLFKYRPISK